jgi:hypothetical protein
MRILLLIIAFCPALCYCQNPAIKVPYDEFYNMLEIIDTTIQAEYFSPNKLKSKTVYHWYKCTFNKIPYTGSFAVREEKYYKNGDLKFLRLSPDVQIKTEIYYNEKGEKHKEYFYYYPKNSMVKIKSNGFYTLWSKDWTYNKYKNGTLISTENWKNRKKVKNK